MARILLVEDNEMNRDMLSRRLSRKGFEVLIAVDGQQGVEKTQTESPDLVLMDMSLPVLDGWEATRRLKAASETKHIPIIALTAHALKGDRERCLDAGMDGYLPKPIDVNQLIATVEGFARAPDEHSEAPRDSTWPVFDEAAALTHTGDDRELLKEIVTLFRSDSPTSLKAIKQSIARGNSEGLAMSAHALKGSIATVGGTEGHRLARELEALGRANRVEEASPLYVALEKQIALLDEEFFKAGLVERVTRKAHSPRVPRKRARP